MKSTFTVSCKFKVATQTGGFCQFMCEFLEERLLFTCIFVITYATCCTPCHHKQLGPLLSTKQKHNEWQAPSAPCQVTQLKIHDTEPSNTTVECICQSGRPLQDRDHTLFIRASKMSQRCGCSVCFLPLLPRTIVRLCCFSLFLFAGLLFFLAFVILT